jgi:hypothetical protein
MERCIQSCRIADLDEGHPGLQRSRARVGGSPLVPVSLARQIGSGASIAVMAWSLAPSKGHGRIRGPVGADPLGVNLPEARPLFWGGGRLDQRLLEQPFPPLTVKARISPAGR